VTIVGVLSPLRLRYSRLSGRNRPDDPKMLKELEERDRVELSVGLGEVLALSDIYIINEEGLKELRENVKKKILAPLTSRFRQT
jgi:dephospho-CoA kinase